MLLCLLASQAKGAVMEKYYALIIVLSLHLSGCSGKPSAAIAKEHLKKSLLSEFGQGVEVASFKKTNATAGELLGVKFYDMDYSYELTCKAPVPITALNKLSAENVSALDEFLKKQTGPWYQIDFTPILNLRLSTAGLRVLSDAYEGKKSLFFCKPGDKLQLTGSTRFVLRENGWEID